MEYLEHVADGDLAVIAAPPMRGELARVRPVREAIAYGSRTDVQFGCGNICAQAVLAGIDPQTGRASYAVRIANNSQHQLAAQVRFGKHGRVPATELTIAPFSIAETLVPRPPSAAPYDRAIVEVRSSGRALFAIDAPASVASRARLGKFIGAGAALVAAAAVSFTVMLHAKPNAMPVQPVAQASVRPRHEALLDDLEVAPSPVVAGNSLRVRYDAHASRGQVWLLDSQGRVWGRAPMRASGSSSVFVPQSAAGRDLRVVVSAQRGSEHAQIATGVSVVPDASNLATSDESAPSGPSEPSVLVSPQRVAAGGTIHVALARDHGEALLSITDPGGSILEEVDVAPGTQSATLRAPQVGAPSTYDVVVSITRGNAQDQIVRPVTVVP